MEEFVMVDVRPAAWCAALGALLAAVGAVHAGPIQGHQFQVQEIVGGKVVPGSVRTFKVKSDPHHVEVTNWGPGSHVSLDFFAFHPDKTGGILLTSNATAQFARTSDILQLTDADEHPDRITNFRVLAKSPDLNSISWGWRIAQGPDFIAVNLGGIHFTSHSHLEFGFTVADPPKPPHPKDATLSFATTSATPRDTPEPGTLVLLGAGAVTGLAGWWWRRRRGGFPGLDKTAAAG
jgi:PEP-CTERM motif